MVDIASHRIDHRCRIPQELLDSCELSTLLAAVLHSVITSRQEEKQRGPRRNTGSYRRNMASIDSLRCFQECTSTSSNHLSALHGRPWNCTQSNFTAGARGSLKQTQFQDRLHLLGVTNPKAREKIRALTVSKTLALSDIILKLFHVSILRSPEWALSSLPTELANLQTSAFKLFKKITGPFSRLVI